MEYKVVPFVASINPRTGTSDQVAEQLETLINQGASGGWNYVRLEKRDNLCTCRKWLL